MKRRVANCRHRIFHRNVEGLEVAASEAVQNSVRDQPSKAAFSSVLEDREYAGDIGLSALDNLTVKWGVNVDAVKLENTSVDDSMIRAMGRVAEAERVRAARLIEASADLYNSRKLVLAGENFGSGDGILGPKLREMQKQARIAAKKTTTMMIIPATIEAAVSRSLEAVNQYVEQRHSNQNED